MHFLAELSLRRGAVVVLAAVAILLGGVFVATRLKTELIPDVDFPVLTVVTTYPGAGPEDVAEQISKPIEQAISGVPRLESLQSTSAENLSILVAQFQFGTNMKEVEATINDNLKVVTLPPAASTPKAARINLQAMPIVQLSLSGDKDVAELEKIARERIVPEIQSIDGVYSVDLAGGAKKQVSIALDPQKMRDNGVSVQQVAGVVQANNMAIPSGSTTVNGQAIIVRTLHQFTSLEELENLAVGASGSRPTNLADQPQSGPTQQPSAAPPSDTDTVASGSILDLTSPPSPSAVATDSTQIATQPPPVASTVPTDSASPATPATPPSPTPLLLKDIATVTVGSSQDSGLVRTNGQPGVGLAVAKTEDGNTVKVANAVTDKLEAIKKELPEGLTLTIISDQSTFIEESIDSLLREGALGAIFAVIVIFVFLLSVRSTLVSAVSIPLSVMAALLLLQWQGLTINIMTLGGLTIAIGRVVDDAIVVLENIHRHARQGEDIARAVRSGTKEVASAITSSTLTTICVFLPLGLVGGLVGQFFLPFALTVTFALLASLVVALTVVPVLAKYLVGTKPGQATERDTWVQRLYTPVLTWSLRHRVVTLAVTAVVFLGSFGLLPFIPTTFLPSMQEKTLTIDLSLPPGADNAASLVRVEEVERILGNMPDVDVYQATMGGAGGDLAMLSSALSGRGTGGATFFVRLREDANVEATAESIRHSLEGVEGASASVSLPEESTSSQLQVIVSGQNAADVQRATAQILEKIQDTEGLLNLHSDLTNPRPEIAVQVDPNKALMAGLTTAQVASEIRDVTVGQTVTQVRLDGGPPVDVHLAPSGGGASSIEALKSIPFGDAQMPLSSLGEVEIADGPVQITRIDQKPAASITGDIVAKNTGAVSQELQRKVNGLTLPAGVKASFGGVISQMEESFYSMFIGIGVAVLLVYIVIVVAFGSLLDPFAILISLPLASTGVLGSLFLTGRSLGLSALIGLLMLVGIVVTNAIVLIDFVKRLIARGYSVHDALVEGGRLRVRPILMTALATILALIPLSLGLNQGTIIAAELGTVVIGGLLTSTLLTLVVVPVIYSIFESLKLRLMKRERASDTTTAETSGE